MNLVCLCFSCDGTSDHSNRRRDIRMSRRILTYGTFDLFHVGHLNLLRRLKEMGDYLAVGVSSDEFNTQKGKRTIIGFKERAEIVRSIRYVDDVFPESSWDQKVSDIKNKRITTFAMGADWTGKFDFLRDYCDVVYLPRTQGISSTDIKSQLGALNRAHTEQLKVALDLISEIVGRLE